jgi:hypothetical protein
MTRQNSLPCKTFNALIDAHEKAGLQTNQFGLHLVHWNEAGLARGKRGCLPELMVSGAAVSSALHSLRKDNERWRTVMNAGRKLNECRNGATTRVGALAVFGNALS